MKEEIIKITCDVCGLTTTENLKDNVFPFSKGWHNIRGFSVAVAKKNQHRINDKNYNVYNCTDKHFCNFKCLNKFVQDALDTSYKEDFVPENVGGFEQ